MRKKKKPPREKRVKNRPEGKRENEELLATPGFLRYERVRGRGNYLKKVEELGRDQSGRRELQSFLSVKGEGEG